jgi:hypothetical protein
MAKTKKQTAKMAALAYARKYRAIGGLYVEDINAFLAGVAWARRQGRK